MSETRGNIYHITSQPGLSQLNQDPFALQQNKSKKSQGPSSAYYCCDDSCFLCLLCHCHSNSESNENDCCSCDCCDCNSDGCDCNCDGCDCGGCDCNC